MKPNTPQDDRPLTVPSRDDATTLAPDRDAAARLMRDQIDKIYETTPAPVPEPKPEPAPHKHTYHQTHSDKKAHDATSHDEHLTKYHTAWQQYYQQYYERYYLTQLAKFKPAPEGEEAVKDESKPVTKDEAVHELRDQLLGKVKDNSQKVRRSRHFMPIISAVAVALVFLFLQYNPIIIGQIKSWVSPGAIDPQNVVIDNTAKVGPEPKLIIPKINVDAPVVYGIGTLNEAVIEKNLQNGVVHYELPGADSVPGQKGNTVILGHSSMDVFDDGGYKFVFAQLEKMQVGDVFYMNYNTTRYTYRISEKKVILPNQVSTLIISTDKPLVSLVTCVPVGTALKRLVVTAEQITPDPTQATAPQVQTQTTKPTGIPGNPPSFLQRLFGG